MYDFWDYCNAVRRNVLATTLFIAVVRVNETKFLSNLTLSSFSAGLDFGWGGDVCKRGGWKCMCGCWRFLVVRLCCKPGFRGGPGGNRRVGGGGPPPPWKADRDITGPNSCTCTARPLILATQGGTQVAHRYLSRLVDIVGWKRFPGQATWPGLIPWRFSLLETSAANFPAMFHYQRIPSGKHTKNYRKY